MNDIKNLIGKAAVGFAIAFGALGAYGVFALLSWPRPH